MAHFTDKIQTAIVSIATTGIISCAGFLWKVNSTLASIKEHIQERDVQIDKKINDIQLTNNNIQLDIRELRDKTIRIETIQNPH